MFSVLLVATKYNSAHFSVFDIARVVSKCSSFAWVSESQRLNEVDSLLVEVDEVSDDVVIGDSNQS